MAFWPKTLDESAEWLTGKGIKEATGRELLRLGAAGYIYIGLLLSCRGFSPTENFKNEDKVFDKKRVSDAPINEREWRNAHDRAYIDLDGFYIVPPKVLFELELNGEAKTEIVFKPEPEGLGDYFYVYKDVTFDELRMSIYHLEKLKTSIIKSDIHIVGDAGTGGSQDGTEPDGITKPRMGGYKERDDFAINLVQSRPELLGMRPGKIKTELQAASNLFTSGYPDWWRNNRCETGVE